MSLKNSRKLGQMLKSKWHPLPWISCGSSLHLEVSVLRNSNIFFRAWDYTGISLMMFNLETVWLLKSPVGPVLARQELPQRDSALQLCQRRTPHAVSRHVQLKNSWALRGETADGRGPCLCTSPAFSSASQTSTVPFNMTFRGETWTSAGEALSSKELPLLCWKSITAPLASRSVFWSVHWVSSALLMSASRSGWWVCTGASWCWDVCFDSSQSGSVFKCGGL